MSISILINVLVCVSLSFSIYLITKNLISDRFLTNEHAYVSILLSPGIYIITIAISDNWALSLGMIGALSIVRFRNPVRSSFELTLFFIYIVIGIAVSVSILLCLLIWVVTLLGIYIVDKYMGREKKIANYEFISYFEINSKLEKLNEYFDSLGEALLSLDNNGNEEITVSISTKDYENFVSFKKDLSKLGKLTKSHFQKI